MAWRSEQRFAIGNLDQSSHIHDRNAMAHGANDGEVMRYKQHSKAVFAAEKTGKQPMVVILDTNGIEEAAEYQVETVARRLGIDYVVYDADFLLRWQMTQLFRERRDALLAQTSGAVPLN